MEREKGRKKEKSANEDIQEASKKLSKSYKQINTEKKEKTVDRWKSSVKYAKRAADTAIRKTIRKIESVVYKNIMTKVSPYYFDNGLINANINRIGKSKFSIEININDEDMREEVKDIVLSTGRWHSDESEVSDIDIEKEPNRHTEGYD